MPDAFPDEIFPHAVSQIQNRFSGDENIKNATYIREAEMSCLRVLSQTFYRNTVKLSRVLVVMPPFPRTIFLYIKPNCKELSQ
jgi:hypothetical protein